MKNIRENIYSYYSMCECVSEYSYFKVVASDILTHGTHILFYFLFTKLDFELYKDLLEPIITSPPEGVARYCFHPVCVCVCLCICVSVFWYFISRLLEEISILILYRILIWLY